MKLELNHLAPYLPYNLQICFDGENPHLNWNIMKCSHLAFESENYKDFRFKPILRPLSDLIKEIEVNGEKFKPIENIPNTDVLNWYCNLLNINGNMTLTTFFKLTEWHFDVFGLIENGLAIDINTIK